MSKVSLGGSPTGTATFDIVAPATNTSRTIELPDGDGTFPLMRLETAKVASGTAVDFTGIPSWVKRITLMFNGLSTSGTSRVILRLGDSGGIEDTGYAGVTYNLSATASVNHTSAFIVLAVVAATTRYTGQTTISKSDVNTQVINSGLGAENTSTFNVGFGAKTLSDELNQLRITTENGTDTFDAGTINLLLEGY